MRQSLYKSGVEAEGSLQAHRGTRRARRTDRFVQPPLHHAACWTRRSPTPTAASTPCSIALIDLDWFKRINDTYGHPTGDEVLRTFAITVFANIRGIDKFGRYGGEEFLLVLPDTPGEGAARILDRLRAIIADLDWSAFSPGMQVTISAGVATLKPNETPDIILARADSALYAAKARGRNRIASA